MTVVTVYDSYVQQTNPRISSAERHAVTVAARRAEDIRAVKELGSRDHLFAGLRDDVNDYSGHEIRAAVDIAAGKPCWADVELWLPMHHEGGHLQHNAVADAFAGWIRAHHYTTYIRATGRVRNVDTDADHTPDIKVVPQPEWITRKLRAMAHYQSQIEIAALGNSGWFMDLREYVAHEGPAAARKS